MGKNKTTTTSSAPDAASQGYINQMRQQAQNVGQVATGGAPEGGWFTGQITNDQLQGAMNPYISNVIDATRGEFDHLRAGASMGAGQQATQAGAYGGSRHAVMEGARLGELDRAQASQIAGLHQQGYQNAQQWAGQQQQLEQQKRMGPLWAQQQALQAQNMGMGPVGMQGTQTTRDPWAPVNAVAGLGMTAAGMGLFG